jgi:hypothetical protein
MHRMPALQWKTWVRLAFVRGRIDWRSLNDLAVEGGQLRDYLLVPAMHRGGYGVRRWDEPTGVVASESRPSNGAFSVADPRVEQSSGWNAGQHYGVHRMDDTAGAITAQAWPNQGRFAVADTRLEDNEFHGFRVVRWDRKAGTVTGARAPGSSAQAVADPRHAGAPKFSNELAVGAWGDGARAVTSAHGTGQCIADPRGGEDAAALHGKYPVTPWGDPARTVIAGNANGAFAVADPRGTPAGRPFGKYHCAEWDEATKTVIASDDHGAYAVADPRTGLDAARGAYLTGGHYGVVPWDATSGAVSAAACHDSGRWSLADPRTCEMEQFVKFEMPAADQKLVAHIVSEDGTWHRPFTTLELAALQSLFDPEDPARSPRSPMHSRPTSAATRRTANGSATRCRGRGARHRRRDPAHAAAGRRRRDVRALGDADLGAAGCRRDQPGARGRMMDRPTFDHSPIAPVREGHPEQAFLTTWRELAAKEDFLEVLFAHLPWNFDQRCANVAASFATWLGTNSGGAFLTNASHLNTKVSWREQAFVCAWAIQNKRAHHTNSNLRTIEFLLSPDDLTGGGRFETATSLTAYAKLSITMQDIDVIDTMVAWLGTPEGDRFVAAARARAHADARAREILQR